MLRVTHPVRRSTSPARGFHGWRIVRTFAVAQTVSWGILYYSFTVLLLPMQRDLGVSLAALTGAFSVAVVAAGIAAVPVGGWLDRYGGRALMSLGGLAGALLVLAWSQVETVAGLYLTFAGIGVVSAAVLYDPAFAVVVRWFRRDRARALLAITLVAGFASTIFTPLTAALEQSLGWRHALWVLAGILAATTVVPYAVVLRRDPADLGQHPDGDPVAPDPDPDDAEPRRSPDGARPSLRATAHRVGRDRTFWLLATAYTAQSLGIVVVAVHLVPLLVDAGHSVGFAAVATGALGALSVAGRVAVTGAVGRWPTSRVAAAVFAVQAAGCLLLLGAGSTTAGAIGFVLLFGIGFGVGTITRPALVADAFGTATFATVTALLGIALTAAKAAGPVAAGLLHATSGYGAVLLLTTSSFAVAAAAVWASGASATTAAVAVRETTAA